MVTPSSPAWNASAPSQRDLPEQVFLGGDVVVERGLLDAERLGEVSQGRALVAPLGEEPGRDAR